MSLSSTETQPDRSCKDFVCNKKGLSSFVVGLNGLMHLILLLKGLAMIFSGQENPWIIFRSRERYIYIKQATKST